jgi:hypothetical protein
VQIVEAQARSQLDQVINLVPSTQANAFSLANLPAGVHTLDVLTQKGDEKAAYQGILLLGQEPTNPQTIIERENDDNDRVFIFIPDPVPPDDVPPDDVPP